MEINCKCSSLHLSQDISIADGRRVSDDEEAAEIGFF
jgi:hypothetical protein